MMTPSDPKKPQIAVSSCLLGNAVRYDGTDKYNEFICNHLAKQFELIPFCPEADAGLGTPRPPIRLNGDPQKPLALGIEDSGLDVTAALTSFTNTWLAQTKNISGIIVKSRSPSCGLFDTPVFDHYGQIRHKGAGLFTQILIQRYPLLPIIDETTIIQPNQLTTFVKKVRLYSA